jgi:hypothetical protein
MKVNLKYVLDAVNSLVKASPAFPYMREKDRVDGRFEYVVDGVDDYVSLQFDRKSWGAEVNLGINFRRNKIEITWSSAGRSPVQAVTAIALYSEVTTLAASIQAVLESYEYEDAPWQKKAQPEAS